MNIIRGFFLTLGVIFFCLLLVGTWFYIADPYEIRPLIAMLRAQPAQSGDSPAAGSSSNPALSPAQSAALESVGIDPSTVPSASSFTPEQRTCMLEAVGEARAQAILGGAVPTAEEFAKARACL
jgi:hypothetical protein